MAEQVYIPEDGAGGVIYVRYDVNDVCQVTREAMEWMLRRGGFVEQHSTPTPAADESGAGA